MGEIIVEEKQVSDRKMISGLKNRTKQGRLFV